MRPAKLNFDPNPAFGSGTCRRLIRIVANAQKVRVDLSDNFHQMRCQITHDGRSVSTIEGKAIRVPTSACPAAAAVLNELVGVDLQTPESLFYGAGRARRHCTHLYDLAVIAIHHAQQGPHIDELEALVPDETGDPVWIQITRNGAIVHRWSVKDGLIVLPRKLAGKTLGSGFANWASQTFQGQDLEAATVLARTWLIAIGRRYLIESASGRSIGENEEMIDRCFAYSTERKPGIVFNSGQVRESDQVSLDEN